MGTCLRASQIACWLRRRAGSVVSFRPRSKFWRASASGPPARSWARRRNQQAIWDALKQVPMATLRERVPARPDVFGGWLELAYAVRNTPDNPDATRAAVADWRTRYPDHPANSDARLELLLAYGWSVDAGPVEHLALLLPLSGELAPYGNAIKTGFMAAYQARERQQRPTLSVIDVSAAGQTAADAYRRAVDEGADRVVGPLRKPALASLDTIDRFTTPLLALNRLPPDTEPAPGLYQFGLAPEDDARSIARHATDQGLGRAVSLTPATDWGERVQIAFREALERNGARLVEHAVGIPVEHSHEHPDLVGHGLGDRVEPDCTARGIGESLERVDGVRQLELDGRVLVR